jgi:hypothetical protein
MNAAQYADMSDPDRNYHFRRFRDRLRLVVAPPPPPAQRWLLAKAALFQLPRPVRRGRA